MMDITRCYFCKNKFDTEIPHLPTLWTCTHCPLEVNHFEADSGAEEFDYITIDLTYDSKRYQITFNPSYGDDMDLLLLDHNKDSIHYAYLIATLKRPDNLSPQNAVEWVSKILKMKAFL